MGKHEYRHTKGRIIAPGLLSFVEHPPAHHDGSRGCESLTEFLVVRVSLATGEALDLAEGGQIEHPLLDEHAPIAQGVPRASVGARDKPIQRHRHVRGDYSHAISSRDHRPRPFTNVGPPWATALPIKPMQKSVRQDDNPSMNPWVRRARTLFTLVTLLWSSGVAPGVDVGLVS